jgi:predicted phosphoribosyltransferase
MVTGKEGKMVPVQGSQGCRQATGTRTIGLCGPDGRNRPSASTRGGVPVAYEVALALNTPLDVFLVRKLGVPGHEELAFGAIASGDARVLNKEVVETLNIPNEAIDTVAQRELLELERRERAYRGEPSCARNP